MWGESRAAWPDAPATNGYGTGKFCLDSYFWKFQAKKCRCNSRHTLQKRGSFSIFPSVARASSYASETTASHQNCKLFWRNYRSSCNYFFLWWLERVTRAIWIDHMRLGTSSCVGAGGNWSSSSWWILVKSLESGWLIQEQSQNPCSIL
jgi:hypothetical protein